MIDILSQSGVIVIPVNMVGVMGAGLAKEARDRIPGIGRDYELALKLGDLKLGQPAYIPQRRRYPPGITGIVLFATKDRWSAPSRTEWIESGLEHLSYLAEQPVMAKDQLWVPALGCGLGGLDPLRVYGSFVRHLGEMPRAHFIGPDRTEWTMTGVHLQSLKIFESYLEDE